MQLYSRQLINAVNYMHKLGYLHLDIKPQNVLVDECLNIKLADFGSSWLFSKSDSTEKDDYDLINEVKGTSYFLAPESIYNPKKN